MCEAIRFKIYRHKKRRRIYECGHNFQSRSIVTASHGMYRIRKIQSCVSISVTTWKRRDVQLIHWQDNGHRPSWLNLALNDISWTEMHRRRDGKINRVEKPQREKSRLVASNEIARQGRENANGAGPRHVSGMYVIPISLLSRERRTRKEKPQPHPSHKNARIRTRAEEGERSLRCHLRTRGNPFSARFAPDLRAARMTTTETRETRERRSRRGWKASASRAPELSMHSIMVMRPRASLENYVDVIPHPPFAPSSPSPLCRRPYPLWPSDLRRHGDESGPPYSPLGCFYLEFIKYNYLSRLAHRISSFTISP